LPPHYRLGRGSGGANKAFDFEDRRDLLRHEICYCLGQLNKSPEHVLIILGFFERLLKGDYTKIVLHEAVEALGNVSKKITCIFLIDSPMRKIAYSMRHASLLRS
jgi:hypothetical protein